MPLDKERKTLLKFQHDVFARKRKGKNSLPATSREEPRCPEDSPTKNPREIKAMQKNRISYVCERFSLGQAGLFEKPEGEKDEPS